MYRDSIEYSCANEQDDMVSYVVVPWWYEWVCWYTYMGSSETFLYHPPCLGELLIVILAQMWLDELAAASLPIAYPKGLECSSNCQSRSLLQCHLAVIVSHSLKSGATEEIFLYKILFLTTLLHITLYAKQYIYGTVHSSKLRIKWCMLICHHLIIASSHHPTFRCLT